MLNNGMVLKRAAHVYSGQDLLAVRFGDGLSTPDQKLLNIGLYNMIQILSFQPIFPSPSTRTCSVARK